jgi:hypothetical protein
MALDSLRPRMDSNLYLWSDLAVEFPTTFCENAARIAVRASPFRLNRLQTEPDSDLVESESDETD